MKSAAKHNFTVPKFSDNPNWDAGMKIGLLLALFFVTKKLNANAKDAKLKAEKEKAEADLSTKPAAGQAASIKQAINPSGWQWAKQIDGTDKTAIWQIAPQITDLDAVRSYYKDLTEGASMDDDLQNALSAEEYQKFLGMATKGKTGAYYYAPTSEKVPSGYWIITTKEANVRSTPKYNWQHAFGNNIIKKAGAGKILGVSTGKFAYDELYKIVFIEFWTYTPTKEKKTFYVAKSQVEFVAHKDKLNREKQGKIPLEVLQGTDNADNNPHEVISTDTADIYTENFIQVGVAPKGIIIGFPVMTLDTGKGKYIKVKTVQGLIRWINADKAMIRVRTF